MDTKIHDSDEIYRRKLVLFHPLLHLLDQGERGVVKSPFENPVLRCNLKFYDKAVFFLVRAFYVYSYVFFSGKQIGVFLGNILELLDSSLRNEFLKKKLE